jgi:hypothetical protein
VTPVTPEKILIVISGKAAMRYVLLAVVSYLLVAVYYISQGVREIRDQRRKGVREIVIKDDEGDVVSSFDANHLSWSFVLGVLMGGLLWPLAFVANGWSTTGLVGNARQRWAHGRYCALVDKTTFRDVQDDDARARFFDELNALALEMPPEMREGAGTREPGEPEPATLSGRDIGWYESIQHARYIIARWLLATALGDDDQARVEALRAELDRVEEAASPKCREAILEYEALLVFLCLSHESEVQPAGMKVQDVDAVAVDAINDRKVLEWALGHATVLYEIAVDVARARDPEVAAELEAHVHGPAFDVEKLESILDRAEAPPQSAVR